MVRFSVILMGLIVTLGVTLCVFFSSKQTLVNFYNILKNYKGKQRRALFLSYLRLELRSPFVNEPGEVMFMSHNIAFFNMRTLKTLLHEIFFTRQYLFKADTDSPVIVDCGSNIGISILFFKFCYPKARIVGFEPDLGAFNLLKKNTAALDMITLHNVALSSEHGARKLYQKNDNISRLNMSLVPKEKDFVYTTVQTKPLSDFISQDIDFLKLDIEGSELDVLKELERKNKLGFIKEMIIEHHPYSGNSLASLLKILEQNSFHYFPISTHLRAPYYRFRSKQPTSLLYVFKSVSPSSRKP